MRGWTRRWGVLLSSGLGLGVAVACNAILDNRDATYVSDAGATAPACGNGGYMCGRICVQPGNVTYGCGIDSNCRPCGFVHGTGTCKGTSCVLASCDPGYAHCSQDPSSGCETAISTDAKNCGRCGNACGAGASCSNGQCLQGCQAPNTPCGTSCINLDDPHTCGSSCGGTTDCLALPPPPDPNAFPVCDAGSCDIACDFPAGTYCSFEGYCADLSSDNNNCGVCGLACVPGATCIDYGCCVAGGGACLGGVSCCPGLYPGGCTDGGLCCLQPGDPCFANDDCCSGTCLGANGTVQGTCK